MHTTSLKHRMKFMRKYLCCNHLMALELDVCRFIKKAHAAGGIKGTKFIDLIFNNMNHSPKLMQFL